MEDTNPTPESASASPSRTKSITRVVKHFPYWILPLISALVWFGMLWAMLIFWLAQGSPKYASMAEHQTIAYISDVGADLLRPLFITASATTGLGFFGALCAMRRQHALRRRLERYLDLLSILAGLLGTVSLVLLATFDTLRHPMLHRLFLLLFMLGVVFSALFTTVEYRRLGKTFHVIKVIEVSYRTKQALVIIEAALSVAFGVTMATRKSNASAVLEWLIAFVFTFYVLSFFFDLRPAARTKELVVPTGSEMQAPIQAPLEHEHSAVNTSTSHI